MPRPRDPSIDRRIVDACVSLLDEVGRVELTRAKIAARAGVSLPSVNRRFRDVDEILVVVASTPPRGPDRSERASPEPQTLRDFLVERLTQMVDAFAEGGVRRPAAELLAAAAGDQRIDAAFKRSLDELRSGWLARIEGARSTGELAAHVDGDTLLDLVTGTAYYRLLWRGVALTGSDVGPLVDLILRGAGRP